MIWIVAAAVTVATIAFVVYLFYLRPRAYARHGALEVPGDDKINLPAGEVGIFYEDNQRWRFSDRPQVADGFSVMVSDEAGGRVDIAEPGTDLVWKSSGKNRIPYGVLSLASPGTFRVVSQMSAEPDKARITFGDPIT